MAERQLHRARRARRPDRIFSYRTMRDYPVIVTVGTLETDALAAVRDARARLSRAAIFFTLLVIVGCTFGILLLARNERSSQTLREQASLLDKAQDAIVVTDLDRRLTFWNKSAERLYGWTADEVMGKVGDRSVLSGRRRREVQQAFDDVHAQRRMDRRAAAAHQDRPPRDHREPLDAGPRRRGEPRSILSINTDVTDRRQLEQQFYRAQRLESIGTLAGGIAHDLNNVLAPIMLGMGILKDRLTDDDSREVLATISTSAKRGAEMVSQVLSFARGQEGRRVEIRVANLVDRRRAHRPRHVSEKHRDRHRRSAEPAADHRRPDAVSPGAAQPVRERARCDAGGGGHALQRVSASTQRCPAATW